MIDRKQILEHALRALRALDELSLPEKGEVIAVMMLLLQIETQRAQRQPPQVRDE